MKELTQTLNKPLFFTEVEQLRSISSGRQKEYFTVLSKIIREIKVSKLSSVFTLEQIDEIKRVVNPQQKQCYKNAQTFALLFKQVHYSECRLDVEQILSVDHAINKVGDKYVDITLELCLGENPEECRYTLIKDFDDNDVIKVQQATQSYANVYETLYRLNH
jgi:hypothetical protein